MATPKTSRTQQGTAARAAGFALIATISMMSLVVVLTLGLLALSVSATRQHAASREGSIAQANARLALAMALGDLQKFAGPDQRITATADIAGDIGGTRLAAGKPPLNTKSLQDVDKGLSPVQPGTRYWTGVWTNSRPADEIYTRTPSPTFIQWLVSGNGGRAARPAVTPASPAVAVTDGGATNDGTAVLVGRGSVGAPNLADNLERYVAAPILPIAAPAGATAKALGRYAWWIGDEGVKARINLGPAAGTTAIATYRNLAARKRGWETVDGFRGYPTYGSPDLGLLDRLLTLPETGLLDPSITTPQGATAPIHRVFHAATTDSRGVIADTLRGGLRIDLSASLDRLGGSKAVPGVPNPPLAGTNIIPKTGGTDYSPKLGPKWDRLEAFVALGKESRGGKLVVRGAASNAEPAVAPAIIDLRLLMGARVALVAGSTTAFHVHPVAKVAISLANPYPCTLEWTSPLDLEIVLNNDYHVANRPSCVMEANGQPAYIQKKDEPGKPAVFHNARFRIAADSLPPGEAKAYTIGAPFVRAITDLSAIVVPLVPFADSDPSNFLNSVQLLTTFQNTGTVRLDVRESWTTTLIDANLLLGNKLVRRIERFEIDNAPFAPTQRAIDPALAARFTAPFPLQLYSFQLSQPGADYASLLPAGNFGLRSSTVRTFADFNVQATRFRRPILSYNPTPYFMQIANSAGYLPFQAPGGDTGSEFTRNLALTPMRWGRSPVANAKTVLFSPPETIVSLGQLQHADLTADDLYGSVGHQPGNAAGNSYAPPFVQRTLTSQRRNDYVVLGSANSGPSGTLAQPTTYYDLSYLLNAALWDSFFFSGIRQSGLPDPVGGVIVKIDPADTSSLLRTPAAAARLMIDGAFNVNSTEKDAWKALLAANRQRKHPAGGNSEGAMFPRSLEQTAAAKTPPSGTGADSFAGYRRLTDEQVDAVATEMVRQVRQRGPFVSLSHFVNRSLVDLTRNKDLGRCGALQSALDLGGANIDPQGAKSAFSDLTPAEDQLNIQADGSAPRADLPGTDGSVFTATDLWAWPPTSLDDNPGAMASILADKPMLLDKAYRPEQGFRSTGIPGWVTQADVLQAIGPSLATRSDTFRLRAYGEAISPVNGKVTARAWCEAVVQRLPDYLAAQANAADDRDEALAPLNKLFGRRFQLVSFRWLAPTEI